MIPDWIIIFFILLLVQSVFVGRIAPTTIIILFTIYHIVYIMLPTITTESTVIPLLLFASLMLYSAASLFFAPGDEE